MAGVNISTGRVIGCKKGSLTWWHEQGHLEYDDSAKGIKNHIYSNMMLQSCIFCAILALFLHLFKYPALVFVVIWLALDVYEEVWCWIYAHKKFNRGKKHRSRRKRSQSP